LSEKSDDTVADTAEIITADVSFNDFSDLPNESRSFYIGSPAFNDASGTYYGMDDILMESRKTRIRLRKYVTTL
jgi:hypothetical protein